MMKRIFVFRHGETDWNREGRMQGHLDIPINETGRDQANRLATQLLEHRIEAILSSDLLRAQQTAGIVSAQLGVPVFLDARLREAHLGEAQGLTRDEIIHRFGESALERWRSSHPMDADVSYSGGETGRQVRDRVFTAIETFLSQNSFEILAVSTHGGVIRRMIERIHPPQTGRLDIPIHNGVLYQITFDPKQNIWDWVKSPE